MCDKGQSGNTVVWHTKPFNDHTDFEHEKHEKPILNCLRQFQRLPHSWFLLSQESQHSPLLFEHPMSVQQWLYQFLHYWEKKEKGYVQMKVLHSIMLYSKLCLY